MTRRLRRCLVCVALLLAPRPAAAAWAFVQVSTTATLAVGVTQTNTTPSNISSSANTLVSWATFTGTTGSATFSGCGATWTTDKTVADATNGQSVSVGHGTTPTAAACTITATVPNCSGAACATVVAEYSGLTASPVDVTPGQTIACSTTANSCTSSSSATTVTNDAIIGWFFDDSGATGKFTVGTSPLAFNAARLSVLTSGGTSLPLLLEDVNQPAATSTAATAQAASGTPRAISIMMAFKQSAAGAATPCLRSLLGVGCDAS